MCRQLAMKNELEERFWSKVEKAPGDECWTWKGAVTGNGYGYFWLDGVAVRAHRVAFWLTNGTWPEVVAHLCNNRVCVRPLHLKGCTQKENINDAHQQGRIYNVWHTSRLQKGKGR